jgi:hypothetical protein
MALRKYWSLARTARNKKVQEELRQSAHERLFRTRVKIESWLEKSVYNALRSGSLDISDLLDGTVFGKSLKQGVSFRLPLASCYPTVLCAGGCYAHDGLDASISTVIRGVLNGCFARYYEQSIPSERDRVMKSIEPHTRAAVRQALFERDVSG